MTPSNMTTEDRLAEKLKTSPMSEFFSEDDLLAICRKAINKAFFEDQPGAYSDKTKRATIVTMAEEALSEKVKAYIDEKFSEIVNDDEFKMKIGNLMISTLGGVLIDSLRDNWKQQFFRDIHENSSMISQIVRRHS